MEDIAVGMYDNVFWTPSNSELLSAVDPVYNRLCSIEPRGKHELEKPVPIIDRTTYEAASRYKNKLNSIPSWMPGFKQWKNGQIPFFTYRRGSE